MTGPRVTGDGDPPSYAQGCVAAVVIGTVVLAMLGALIAIALLT